MLALGFRHNNTDFVKLHDIGIDECFHMLGMKETFQKINEDEFENNYIILDGECAGQRGICNNSSIVKRKRYHGG